MFRIGACPLTHACRSPRRVTGVQASVAFTDAEMFRGHFIWHRESRDQISGVHSFVSELLMRQGAVLV